MYHPLRTVAVTSLLLVSLTVPVSAQRIHAVLVSDTSPSAHWGIYEPNLSFDILNMSGFFETNSPQEALTVSFLSISQDDESTPANVLAAVRRLKPQPNDTVVFYFTGHGGLDDRGSFFELAGGKLYRDEVRGVLKGMRPRLAVLLTDCCNSRSDGRRQIAAAPMFPQPDRFTPFFESLFVTPAGVVDINSSAPGESAFFLPANNDSPIPPGSIFTSELTEWARVRKDQRVTWDELLREVGIRVHMSFREAFPKGVSMSKGATVQTDQNVFAREYPGIPEARGYRIGIQVRDNDGRGAMIVEIVPSSPATAAYDIAGERYVSLAVGVPIITVNGKNVGGAEEFRSLVKESPQILRLSVEGGRQYLVRLRF